MSSSPLSLYVACSAQDYPLAWRVAELLTAARIDVTWAGGVWGSAPGNDWVEATLHSSAILVIWSADMSQSARAMVELGVALERARSRSVTLLAMASSGAPVPHVLSDAQAMTFTSDLDEARQRIAPVLWGASGRFALGLSGGLDWHDPRNVPSISATPDTLGAYDARLVGRVRMGDETAFSELVSRYSAKVSALAGRLSGESDAAEEIVREAVLETYDHLQHVEGEVAFATLITRLTAQKAIDRLRRRGKPERPTVPITQWGGVEEHTGVYKLNVDHQAALNLRAEGLDIRDSAYMLGIGVDAVQRLLEDADSLLSRGVRRPGGAFSTSGAATAPAKAPLLPRAETYTVRLGDTLSKIAKVHLGNANAYMRIFEMNKDQLSDPDKIRPGQVLKLPTARSQPVEKTYTVRAGDTLSRIAKEYLGNANAYMEIFELNKDQLSDPDRIKPGQVLKLPKR